jgi:hypothetical protein
VDRSRHVSTIAPVWLVLGRQTITFALGVAVIIDAVATQGTHNVEITDGLILLGIVPVDAFLSRLPFPHRGTDEPVP